MRLNFILECKNGSMQVYIEVSQGWRINSECNYLWKRKLECEREIQEKEGRRKIEYVVRVQYST